MVAVPPVRYDSVVCQVSGAQVGIKAIIDVVGDDIVFHIGHTPEIIPHLDSMPIVLY